MRGRSQASRDAVLREFEPVATAAGKDAAMLGGQLYSVVDALDSSGSLRRAFTDPARPGTDKGVLVGSLFGALDPRVQELLKELVSRRWVSADDMGDAIEDAAVEAYLAAAESQGQLDAVEEELFRIERTLAAERDVFVALDNRSAIPAARVALARTIFGPRLSALSMALLERAVFAPRGRRLSKALAYFVAAAAARRERSVAHVTSAVELSDAQRSRLGQALLAAYGRDVQVNVSVVPSVIGGIRVQVGHQVVDGTILRKLDDARRRLVG